MTNSDTPAPEGISFKTTFGQKLLAAGIILNLFVLSGFIFSSSQYAISESKIFTSAQSTATSIIFTQRETLAYTTRYAQWAAGVFTKRDVGIARALLAQRLNVINIDQTSTGGRATADYLSALRFSDSVLEKAPEGYLPSTLHDTYNKLSGTFIDSMLAESRKMVVAYQQELDATILASAKKRSSNTLQILAIFLLLVLQTSIFLIWGGLSFRRQYKTARRNLKKEADSLSIAIERLESAESEVKSLEELNARKNDFISTVNHELRTPLTSIIGYIDLLKEPAIKQSAVEYEKIISVIERNSGVLLDLIESILSLSSLDAKDQVSEYKEVDLLAIVKKNIFILTPQLSQKSISINLDEKTLENSTILGNSGQVSLVVLNLLSNAVKFSPNGSQVDVRLSLESEGAEFNFVRFEVKDKGIGIPADEIPKLFTRFYRAKNAVDSHIEGTGLGLAIVAKILENHKAKIEVKSEINQGSTFVVIFPAFLGKVAQLISKNRVNVLNKAIIALRTAPAHELAPVSHEMGGAVGFYDLEKESELINEFNLWLIKNPLAQQEDLNQLKENLIDSLNHSYIVLSGQGSEMK